MAFFIPSQDISTNTQSDATLQGVMLL